jgi:hypothetical protein
MPRDQGSKKQPKVWLISPVYRDFRSFARLIQEVRKEFGASPWQNGRHCFVAIDDTGVKDPEGNQFIHESDCIVLDAPFNLGHQRAIVAGLRWVIGMASDDDIMVTLDSDGEDRPEDVLSLIKGLQNDPKIILARRTRRYEGYLFKSFYFCYQFLFGVLTGQVIRSGNFAAFRVRDLRGVIDQSNFEVCYSTSLLRCGLEVRQVPCPRGIRYEGRSRVGFKGLIRHGLRMLLPFEDRIAERVLLFICLCTLLGWIGVYVGLSLAATVQGLSTYFVYWKSKTIAPLKAQTEGRLVPRQSDLIDVDQAA